MRATASPASGFLAVVVVVAVIPVGVGVDGLAAHFAEGDQHGAVLGRGGHRDGGAHPLRVVRGPLQHLHAAHRAARHAEQLLDAQVVDQLAPGPRTMSPTVTTGKVQPIGLAGRRVDAGRPGGAIAAAEHIAADHKEAVGVEGLAGPDAVVPPAGLGGVAVVIAGGMGAAAERVADQDGIGAVGVEPAIGFVGQRDRAQRRAALQTEGLIFGKGEGLGRDAANGVAWSWLCR